MNVLLGMARYLVAAGFLLFMVLLIGLMRRDHE